MSIPSRTYALLCACAMAAACAQLEDDEQPPIYVTQNPVCVFLCLSTLGTIREQTTGTGGGAVTGGASSLAQTQSAASAAGIAR